MSKIKKFKLNKGERDDKSTKEERRRRKERRNVKEGAYNG